MAFRDGTPRGNPEQPRFGKLEAPNRGAGSDLIHVVATAGKASWVCAEEGAYPFVRVGRAVVMFNPPASKSLYNSPGYPDAQLDHTLQLAVAKLRAAQTD